MALNRAVEPQGASDYDAVDAAPLSDKERRERAARQLETEQLAEKLYVQAMSGGGTGEVPFAELAELCLQVSEAFFDARAEWRTQR